MTKSELFERAKQDADFAIRSICANLIRYKISQQQLADVACVDKGNLSKILSGVIYPNFKTWCRIRLAMDVLINPDWFQKFGEHDDDLPF